jgi:1,4-dihydroxy-2-naphthoyl-CoA hydrolase
MTDSAPPISGYDAHMGLRLIELSASRAVGEIEISDFHLQPLGLVHGGVYAGMVETLASYGASVWAHENGMFGSVGLLNSTDFLRATRNGVLRGVAVSVHQGRNQQIWQVEITRADDGKVAARGQVRLQNVASPPGA